MTPSPERRLGSRGPVVSAIGFGCWAIGGPHYRGAIPIGWGEVDDDESVLAIHAALDEGITFFDTADVYGCGHSERILSRALGAHKADVTIATKFGYTYDEATRQSPGTDASPAYIAWACEQSLKRLGVDAIDVYLFHLGDYPLGEAVGVVDALENLVTAGKIRSFGWSTDDPERAELFAASDHCVAIEQQFNLTAGNAETLAVAERNGVASIVRSPLGMGLLSGRITKDTRFADSDVRVGSDQDASWNRRLELLERLRAILTSDGRTVAQGALGWLLARSDSLIPIPGIRTVAQARENAGVLKFGPLAAEQMELISRELDGFE